MYCGLIPPQLPPSNLCGKCHKIPYNPRQLDCGGEHIVCYECAMRILNSVTLRHICPICCEPIRASTKLDEKKTEPVDAVIKKTIPFRSPSRFDDLATRRAFELIDPKLTAMFYISTEPSCSSERPEFEQIDPKRTAIHCSSPKPSCSTESPEFEKSDEELACDAYDQLIKEQGTQKKHPSKDSMGNCKLIVERFLRIFSTVPDDLKKKFATSPLFPLETKFEDKLDLTTTYPINYIMYTGCVEGLNAILSFLSPEDWNRPGLYNSTWMHCIIAGIEAKSCTYGFGFNGPLKCAEIVLSKSSELATKTNALGATPLRYLDYIKSSANKDFQRILNYGSGGFGGLGKTIVGVGSIDDFDIMLQIIAKIDELLKSTIAKSPGTSLN